MFCYLQEEQMPQKGNVLDRVVQFTALQMFAREAPINKPSLTPGIKILIASSICPANYYFKIKIAAT